MTLAEAVEQHRTVLEQGGIRGIDLDYILDPRVEAGPCLENFNKMIAGPFVRWVEILEAIPFERLSYLKMIEPSHPKVVAAKVAKKDLKNYFKGHVLCFFKDAERRTIEENKRRAQIATDEVDAPLGEAPAVDPFLKGIMERGQDEQQ